MKNKFVAALLAFFLGSFGAHKFYLRDPGAGVFYIMLFAMTSRFMPISAILGFIDGLRYLMMSPEEFDRKFNSRYYKSRQRKYQKKKKPKHDYYEVKKKSKKSPIIKNNPFKKSGIKKYKEYEIEEAIEDFKKGLKLEPRDISLHFNIACAYSLLENKEEAYSYLSEAIKLGFKDFDKIQTHDDLAFLRIQDDYDQFKESGYQRAPKSKATKKKEATKEPMSDVLLSQLNRLMELRKKGVLTENEYLTERKKILVQ